MDRKCCRAMTAECLACSEGVSKQEFCYRTENWNVVGCEKYKPCIIQGNKHSNIIKSKKRIFNTYY